MIDFDCTFSCIWTKALNASSSIGFGKEIEHIQTKALNTSFSIGSDKEIEHIRLQLQMYPFQ